MSVFLKLGWFFRQEWRRYLVAMLALIVVGLAIMVPPWLLGQVVDRIEQGTLSAEFLVTQVAFIVMLAIISYIGRVTWRIALFGASFKLANLLRQRVYRHLTAQSPGFYGRMSTGDLMARATHDIQSVEMMAGEAVLALFDGAFTGLLVFLVLVLTISFPLTVVALLPWPIVGYFMWRFGKTLHVTFNDAQERFSDLNDRVQESMGALRLTRASGREDAERARFSEVAEAASEANMRVASTDAAYDPVIQLGIAASFLLSVAYGAWLIASGDLTLGELTSFSLYLGYMIWPMFAIGWLLNLLERGSAAWRRLESLLATEPDIFDNGTVEDDLEPSLRVNISQFAYAEDSPPALRDIEFELAAGQQLGIVGPTGAGKSTLVEIILRQREQASAAVFLGGHRLDALSLANLRRHIAVVPQSPFLFSTSIRENICLAAPGASDETIIEAAKLAAIHDEICAFPDAYDTLVGERGVTLSGGQKQRIAIARALLQDAPVLVLDDALSAVDVGTERSILAHLREARQRRTTLIVAHRLTAVEAADLIIVLENGEVIERGRHADLMRRQGWYARMQSYQQLERAVEQGR